MIRKLTGKDYCVSAWSGGTTTQLAIYPENAVYGERDFLWRVSSALVELEESDFTPLPDYDRLIATLEGEIVLSHNGGAPLRLRPLEVHAFSGADATHSWGRCKDFNLMLRRGRASGSMEALRLTHTPTYLNVGTSIACPQPTSGETFLLYCAEGSCSVGAVTGRPPEAPSDPAVGAVIGRPKTAPVCHSERSIAESKNPSPPISLHAGETLLCTAPISLTLTGTADLMLCQITAK